MNYETKKKKKTVDDISEFVKITRIMPGDIDLCLEHDRVDAKSFLGVMALVSSAIQKAAAVIICFSDSDDYNSFLQNGRFLYSNC